VSGDEAARILVVGEVNPYGSRAEFALYHLPRGASGDRLRALMGLSDGDYLKYCSRTNLCLEKWVLGAARRRAEELLSERLEVVFILLGSRVRLAFGGPSAFCVKTVGGERGEVVLVGLPHPSGRNRLWNDSSSRLRVPARLRTVAPWVPWGSHVEVPHAETDGLP